MPLSNNPQPPKDENTPEANPLQLSVEDRAEMLASGHTSDEEIERIGNFLQENYPKKDLPAAVRANGTFDPNRSILEMIRDGEGKSVVASIKAMKSLSQGTYTGDPFYLGGNKDTSFNR